MDVDGWKKRSEEIHCPLGEEYHCGILTSDIVSEFCFEPAAVVPNVCPRFDIFLSKTITAVDCKGDGCPTTHYITSNLYLCRITNANNKSGSKWTQQIIIPSGLSLLLLLVISSIAVICICKRRKRRIQKNIKSMTNDQISKNPNVLMEESNGYNTIEEVELNIYREDNEDTPRLDESEINITMVRRKSNFFPLRREYCPIQRKEQKSQYSTIQQNSEQDVNSNGE
ncbi:hypothetical protein FSP39_022523 [Pinctada imbricata]|uniref:Uncharacterized protein n=1 Tax=Pinctada imbricata TaxID=66713 RepID=A0AA88YT32_PINIB|nr:hypothetical protein FSP39_022523 [Pinctada imbricata]